VSPASQKLTSAERSLRGSIAANTRWSKTPAAERRRQADRGQNALQEKFAAEIDPDNKLSSEDRAKLAANALRAHMQRLALKSAKARRTETAYVMRDAG